MACGLVGGFGGCWIDVVGVCLVLASKGGDLRLWCGFVSCFCGCGLP